MRDLFGDEPPASTRGRRSKRSVTPAAAARLAPAASELVEDHGAELPASAVESFLSLRTSVCLQSPAVGSVWLVPDYTGEFRFEISAADLARLLAALRIFPGARVASFTRVDLNALPSTSTSTAPSTIARSA